MSSDLPETVPQRNGLTGRTITIERLTVEQASNPEHAGEVCLAYRIGGVLKGNVRCGTNPDPDGLLASARRVAAEANAEFVT